MANHVQNDRGEWVIAVGAPGSMERVRVERPSLIERLNNLYLQSDGCCGRCVDEAIEMIRSEGIRSEMETRSLLSVSLYGEEPEGSVAKLVMRI